MRYTNSVTGQFPASPTPGDLFYDNLSGTFNIISSVDGWQGILPTTGYNSVDGGDAFSIYGNEVES